MTKFDVGLKQVKGNPGSQLEQMQYLCIQSKVRFKGRKPFGSSEEDVLSFFVEDIIRLSLT